ncbi:MAG: hypothetical protein V4702_01690 [Patescibacteria group bacterium]
MTNFAIQQGRIDGRFGCPTLAETAQELIQAASVRDGLLNFLIKVSQANGSARWYADIQPDADTFAELYSEQGPGSFFSLDTLRVAERLVAGGILLNHGGVDLALMPIRPIREVRVLTIGSVPVLRAGMEKVAATDPSIDQSQPMLIIPAAGIVTNA